jgi:hypothetical protein
MNCDQILENSNISHYKKIIFVFTNQKTSIRMIIGVRKLLSKRVLRYLKQVFPDILTVQ